MHFGEDDGFFPSFDELSRREDLFGIDSLLNSLPTPKREGRRRNTSLGKPFLKAEEPSQGRVFFGCQTSQRIDREATVRLLGALDRMENHDLLELGKLLHISSVDPVAVKKMATEYTYNAQMAKLLETAMEVVKAMHIPPQLVNVRSIIRLGKLSDYPTNDIRYSPLNDPEHLIDEPILIGFEPFEYEVELGPDKEESHIIVQSFDTGIAPPPHRWPNTLSIWINGTRVRSPDMFDPLVDITPFLPNIQLTIRCQAEQHGYALVVRRALFSSVETLADTIVAKRAFCPPLDATNIEVFCPISGELMTHPGRGNNCYHSQCFELGTYIATCISSKKWQCPICHKEVKFSYLIFNKTLADYIEDLKWKRIRDKSLLPHPDFSIPLI